MWMFNQVKAKTMSGWIFKLDSNLGVYWNVKKRASICEKFKLSADYCPPMKKKLTHPNFPRENLCHKKKRTQKFVKAQELLFKKLDNSLTVMRLNLRKWET